MKSISIKMMTLSALFAAISCILSPWKIDVGPVPIGFLHISIFISVALLGVKYGTLSQLIFITLGIIGLPVFSGFKGGFGVLAGPTGGFILGYAACAAVTGALIKGAEGSVLKLILSMYAGWGVTYLCGIPWFMFVMKTDLYSALIQCFFIFLPGDLIKTILCILFIRKIKPLVADKI